MPLESSEIGRGKNFGVSAQLRDRRSERRIQIHIQQLRLHEISDQEIVKISVLDRLQQRILRHHEMEAAHLCMSTAGRSGGQDDVPPLAADRETDEILLL